MKEPTCPPYENVHVGFSFIPRRNEKINNQFLNVDNIHEYSSLFMFLKAR